MEREEVYFERRSTSFLTTTTVWIQFDPFSATGSIFSSKRIGKGWWPSLEDWHPPDEPLARLQKLFLAVRQSEGQILLFVNHFHWLLGAEQQRSPIDASRLLKPVLARREIQLIAACTPEQYRQYIERDAAISRRLQEYPVRPDEKQLLSL